MKKNFLWFIMILVLMGCSINSEPEQVKKNEREYNYTSLYYYSMAETAIHSGDFNSAVSLLKKADYYDPENIEIKSRLIDIMSQQAMIKKTGYEEIIVLADDYVERDLYDTSILLNLAEAYNRTENYERAEFYIKMALAKEPSMRMYISYYIFRLNHSDSLDTSILDRALEMPWKDENNVILISDLYKEVDPLKSVSILDSAQIIWDDEDLLRKQLTIFESLKMEDESVIRIEQRLSKNIETSNQTKEYLLGLYFKMQQFDKIAGHREMCYNLSTDQSLRFLFIAELTLIQLDNAIETAQRLELLNNSPENLKPMFYGYYSYLLFKKNQLEESVNKLILCNDVELVLSLIAENGFIIDVEFADIEKFLEYLELKNVNPDFTNFIIGYVYSLLDKPDKSIGRLEKISTAYLKANDLLLTVALAYLSNTQDTVKAKELLDFREVKEPAFNEILAQFYYANQMDSLAYDAFVEIIKDNPKPDLGIFMITSLLGDRLGRFESMMPLMDNGIELYPESADLKNAVGYTIADNNLEDYYSKGELLLTDAVKLDPENGMIWDSLGWLLFKMGEYEKALTAMKLPLDLGVKDSEIAFHLAEIYSKLNDLKQAKLYYELAVELNSNEDSVTLAKKRLTEMTE